ncbi:hypothetical protein PEL8287_01656 [Roseovarius litorisediminis]|uniref:Uncharacterized protein n=1 Tax=Roseovarius litorisediminis TaxID=1312363 RepID=A0A1Y5S826_9RHOB|nr:hypothetical protein [Roseovarius litorisediminis]SLN33970.1 hypothetical protein PEL8287_01656 [Roseovarius litorisediminis]
MTLAGAAIALSGAGILVTGFLALMFLRDPIAGLAHTTHRAEHLPEVMTDRYIAFTILTIGATLYGDMKVIAALFATFAFMGFADAWIYARGGHPIAKHIGAGIAASVVTVVALLAIWGQGA